MDPARPWADSLSRVLRSVVPTRPLTRWPTEVNRCFRSQVRLLRRMLSAALDPYRELTAASARFPVAMATSRWRSAVPWAAAFSGRDLSRFPGC